TQRSLDRIRILVSQTGANVKCAGRYVGLLNGDGKTDQRVEDLAILRAIPDLIVTTPGDAAETREVVRDATAHDGPVYLRLLRDAVAELGLDELPGPDHLTQLRENTDLTVCRPAHRRHTLSPRSTCWQRAGSATAICPPPFSATLGSDHARGDRPELRSAERCPQGPHPQAPMILAAMSSHRHLLLVVLLHFGPAFGGPVDPELSVRSVHLLGGGIRCVGCRCLRRRPGRAHRTHTTLTCNRLHGKVATLDEEVGP